MKLLIVDFFSNYSLVIVFFHVVSAVIWIGGMIALKFAIHYSMQGIEDPKIRLGRTLENLKRFFNLVIPFILILILTAVLLAVGMGFKDTPLYNIIHIKEAIWTFMTIIFIYIYLKRNKAEKLFKQNNFKQSKEILTPISTYLIPINILLGLAQILFGIVLRGF